MTNAPLGVPGACVSCYSLVSSILAATRTLRARVLGLGVITCSGEREVSAVCISVPPAEAALSVEGVKVLEESCAAEVTADEAIERQLASF